MQTKAFALSRPPMRRMIAIQRLLSSKRTAHCPSLASDLEVSSKTMQRDIEFENPILLKRRFARSDGFSVAGLLEKSFGVFEAEAGGEVFLRLDLLAARLVAGRRQRHPSPEIRRTEEGVELLLRFGLSAELERRILGWGAHVEVVGPEGLRAAVAGAAHRMTFVYANR